MSFLGVYSTIAGRVLSHYEVGPPIGHGGMGHVYHGRDVLLGRPVAIKVLPHWARGDPQARERLVREARAASALNHPNIVTIYEIAEHEGVDLMVMEYLPGKRLDELIPSRGLPNSKVRGLAIQLVDALRAAHAAGILHRDLKPSNVIVSQDDRLKLLDFGLAEQIGDSHREAGKAGKSDQFGTRAYMSPEQLLGHQSDFRSEIFSAGLVLYQMLSGKHPFGPGSRVEVADAIRTKEPANLPPKVPPALARPVYRCLLKTPDNRFDSMQDLLTALQESSVAEGRRLARAMPYRPKAPAVSVDVHEVRAITKRISYKYITQSRRSLAELSRLIKTGASSALREAAIADLKNLILTHEDYAGNGVPESVREVRKLVLDVMRMAAQDNLGKHFQTGELELLDLFGMNFAGCELRQVSFRKCLLIESNFRGCNLAGASFASAAIRNVNFTGAELSDADFTNSDWFNAFGLTETQLKRVRQGTLRDCPPDVQAMHRFLDARYRLPFHSWPEQVQEQLHTAWAEYLRPGSLRDAVASWRHTAR